jgi:putative RNA 2'-phosphotransferase
MANWIAYNLRHNKLIKMDESGWVEIDILIALSPCRNDYQKILKDIHYVVRNDKKGRFEIIGNKIRATNGHSVMLKEPIMTKVTQNKFAWVVHGTTKTSWEKIQESGFLKKMNRDYIHFAIDSAHLRNESQVEIYLYLQIEQLLKDGYNLFETTNSVIISFQDIPLKYLYIGERPLTIIIRNS